MDNRTFDITSEGHAALRHALAIPFYTAGVRATHYLMTTIPNGYEGRWARDIPTLALYNRAAPKALVLPFTLGHDGATEFVNSWLSQVDYGPEPDHDGSNGKGFRVFTGKWGEVHGSDGAFVAIQPKWAEYGK